jgi:3-oxoacyl-[acyl-carrier protein] reductase
MGKLDGQVAIVTGGGRGLGRAYAHRLASLGAKVALCDLNLKSYAEFEIEAKAMTGDSTVAEIEAQGGSALGYELDVNDEKAVNAMVADVAKKWGRIDILVCNAGGGRGKPMETKASTLDPALLHLVVGMNLYGTIYFVNAVAPHMKERKFGKIVTVSSTAGLSPSPDGGYAHYGAAKAAIAHYTRYLAQELGPFGINANCIAPGVIATGRIMTTVIPGSANGNRDQSRRMALRRAGTVDDCAKVVEFLCTDLSDYVTGQVIAIDGGMLR